MRASVNEGEVPLASAATEVMVILRMGLLGLDSAGGAERTLTAAVSDLSAMLWQK